jgi:hypothetical protein
VIQKVTMPKRFDGKRPPNPVRYLCNAGHLHPSRHSAFKCNNRKPKEG